MKFKPLHDRVLVEREESDEKSAGGIIIPDTAKEKPMQGKIIAVGSGSKDEQGQGNATGCKSWRYSIVRKVVWYRDQVRRN